MNSRAARVGSMLRRRFTPDAALGLHLTVGIGVVIACCVAFLRIAAAVCREGSITVLDQDVAAYFNVHATPAVTRVIFAVTWLGSGLVLTLLGAMVAVWLLRRRAWFRLAALVIALPGGALLNQLLKHLFERPRPAFDHPIATLATYSFPSAHAMGSTLFYGFAALLAARVARRWPPTVAAIAGAMVLVAAVSFSRVYLGLHFLSDVLGGVVAGAAWLTVAWTATEALRRRAERTDPAGKGAG